MDLPLNILDRVEIASPCTARWEDMTPAAAGDDRIRRCAQCNLNVHNLSAMSRDEAEALVATHLASGKRLCGQWRRRADGTIIFGDCPVGLARVRARARRSLARVCATLGITAIIAGALARAERRGWDPHTYASFTLVSRWLGADAASQTITRTAGMIMPTVKGEISMGKVMIRSQPPPSPQSPTAPNGSQGAAP